MKYAIISDIHSNLEAFERTLLEIDDIGVNWIICLGDIVGYGANPNECVDIIRERNIISIMGNHDVVACGRKEPIDFNPIARDAALWTRNELTTENKDFLNNLPQAKEIEDFLIVHGSLSDPDLYIFSNEDASMEFHLMDNYNICFFGHTHVRIYYVYLNNLIENFYDDNIGINGDNKYLINPGSVGQPRDRDPRASFLIYDHKDNEVKFIRLEYDIYSAQEKIILAGLDKRLAYRLSVGL
ncbi:metallophosphatase family protein [Desulfobacterota bacterium AH_259_B03_O07]|nr:metallophosphatase family protein [Desulfobacterota bacterium AH_259_B03_O07]